MPDGISPLPNSSMVLISRRFGLVGGKLILANDGRTLYGADVPVASQSRYPTGDLHVYGVTPTSVTPLAAPWSPSSLFNPESATRRHGHRVALFVPAGLLNLQRS